MDARKHLIIIKGKDQTDSVASFQFHDGKCEVVYTSAPNKTYSFQSSNVEILSLQKKIDPAQVIVTANGQTISEIDELLDFGGYYRIVRNGKKDLSFCICAEFLPFVNHPAPPEHFSRCTPAADPTAGHVCRGLPHSARPE